MAVFYPNMVPTLAEVHLDATDSSGEPVRPMLPKLSRPMAMSRLHNLWCGFVINDSSVESIPPGQSMTCTVSFLNHQDAHHAVPRGAPFVFGDGFISKGVLRPL